MQGPGLRRERDESALFLSPLMADGRHKVHTGCSGLALWGRSWGSEWGGIAGAWGGGRSEKAFWKRQCVHLLAFVGREPKPLMYLIYTSKEFISCHRVYPSGGLQGGFSGWIQGFSFASAVVVSFWSQFPSRSWYNHHQQLGRCISLPGSAGIERETSPSSVGCTLFSPIQLDISGHVPSLDH